MIFNKRYDYTHTRTYFLLDTTLINTFKIQCVIWYIFDKFNRICEKSMKRLYRLKEYEKISEFRNFYMF